MATGMKLECGDEECTQYCVATTIVYMWMLRKQNMRLDVDSIVSGSFPVWGSGTTRFEIFGYATRYIDLMDIFRHMRLPVCPSGCPPPPQ